MRLWATKYIGKPWRSGARGPDVFDCWGLVQYALREDFMTEVPDFPIAPEKLTEVTVKMTKEAMRGQWVQLSVPEEGAVVGLSHHRLFHHVGIFTQADGGLVIHALDGIGVIANSLQQLRNGGWNRIEFYAPASWHV